ncbi:GspE/PulE family protein [Longivirga aurantiaca]|uniref:GspE/PulE family protein n=1 Tax=Longivirga aurantiaca TaxID=1837743 RepID=A0ABW1SYF5_9ACTN
MSVHPIVTGEEPVGRPRLGDVLVQLGLLDHHQVAAALESRLASGGTRRLGRVVRELGLVDESDLARALAVQHVLPLIDLDPGNVDSAVARLIPRALAERHAVVAFARRGTRLAVAVADPVDVVALDDVRALTGVTGIDAHVAPESRIREALAIVWSQQVDTTLVADFLHEVTPVDVPVDDADPATDAATIRLVDRLLADAVRAGASDLHVEPSRDGVRVRMRVDGVLRETFLLPRTGSSAITARFKIIADLDVIERRLPQDGRALTRVEGERVDLRVSTLPSMHGETVVVRLLPASHRLPRLDALGLTGEQQRLLLDVVHRPQGLVLITGPTGSGKTNTLYAALSEGVDSSRNVITLEDPVEIELPGVTQVHIDERTGMTFGRGLRAALRQDPDVVLVGEIRDRETAELAVRAALTGHLVLSTLHTLDSASAVTRLLDMGVPGYLLTSSLALVLSQRLVRVPCPECAVRHDPDPFLLATLWVSDPVGGWLETVGCLACGGTGYRGRTAVLETLEVGPEVRRALLEGGDESSIRRAARLAGTRSMREQAVELARRGGTTLEEIVRAVPDDPDHSA